eukprot:TRINITY_DN1538_c0_g1_i1.p1 TRINITY_DN1538_c0_g1~~TRINITY_DN1538_c0_g1_i1.p1  ORF type:complete len:123 (-),score=36.09 TRINITY_DN1538_c0_g1_i1:281-649(-)
MCIRDRYMGTQTRTRSNNLLIMSDTFWWGVNFGILYKIACSKAAMEPFTSRPWKFPKYAIIFGLAASYIEWTTRLSLEQICENEEKIDQQRLKAYIQLLDVGEELNHKDLIRDIGINSGRIQ